MSVSIIDMFSGTGELARAVADGLKARFDTYDASDPVKVWGTQEALF